MANIPRQSVPYRFDAFCKKVLRNEAVNYLLQLKQQYQRELLFSDLSYSELQSLCFTEDYPSDPDRTKHPDLAFRHGYDG